MGNKKNAKRPHASDGKYLKCRPPRRWKTPQKESGERSSQGSAQEKSGEGSSRGSVAIDGARIVNISQLEKYLNQLSSHVTRCKSNAGNVVLVGEKRDGLASILSTECSACGFTIKLETSRKVKGPNGYHRWEVNLGAVWGQMSTGSGHSSLQESMAYLGVPVMAKKSFTATERTIGEWWRDRFQQSMIEAGKQERELAIERGDYHEDVPAITVIVDGGWSKRSHRHSYNAKSGVGIIIGLATKKILHLSVRNKYCTGCATGSPQDQHHCYKNWVDSSSAMETSVILEGFRESEKVHGIRYTCFIGDGDSAVYPTLLQGVPGWGRAIKKLECANHACKCYRSSLEKLVQNHPNYKGKGGLTLQMRKRLTSAARCAIKMRSKEADKRKAVKQLEHDLRNGPYHCFGIHDRCSTDFCTHARSQAEQSMTSPAVSECSNDDLIDDAELDDVQDAAAEQERLWQDTVDDTPATEEHTRHGGSVPIQVDPKLLLDVEVLVSRLVAKASQLVGNFTTNLAENWMSVRCKFDGGKVINRSQSGSWEFRCMGAGLRVNIGPTWGPEMWRDMTGSVPNSVLVNTANDTANKRQNDRKRKSTEKSKDSRRQSKYARTDDSVEARKSYSRHDGGIEPDDVSEDISPEHLHELEQRFYHSNFVVSHEQACQIEQSTRTQSETLMWIEERRKRVTASKVGTIAKMRPSTKRAKRVEELLYTNFTGNAATRYGVMMEEEALKQYVAYQQQHGHPGLATEPVGLCISTANPWLAASPDGVVHDPSSTPPCGLVELKNPYSARDMTVQQFGSKRSSCLDVREDGTCRLKHGHDYYYQIQCQLYCTDKAWCDFVVRTDKDMHVERIHSDREWWNLQMDKCQKFYFSALLPELACPRHGKGGIREPKKCSCVATSKL